jgi:hypothetical protein
LAFNFKIGLEAFPIPHPVAVLVGPPFHKEMEVEENEGKNDETETDNSTNLSLLSVVKLQSCVRRFKARKECLQMIETRFEKIYDPKRKKYFYYDIIRDLSSWKKPKLLKDQDLTKVSSLYSQEEAVLLIQNFLRKISSLRKVRMLYQKRIKLKRDPRQKKLTTYYNKVTKQTISRLPGFMEGRLNYDYEINFEDDSKQKSNKKKKKNESESETDSDEDLGNSDEGSRVGEEDGQSTDSDSSSVVRAKRIAARIHPRSLLFLFITSLTRNFRSKAQSLIDACEDRTDKKASLELNLSGIGATRFSSRIYDLSHLRRLVLSNNQLKRISPEIKYLMRSVPIPPFRSSLF